MQEMIGTLSRVLHQRFGVTERGATAVEYGVLLSLIVVVAFGGMQAFGNSVSDLYLAFNTIVQAMVGKI